MYNAIDAVMPIAERPETVFVSGCGSQLTDQQGHCYLDFVQGWAVNTLGHGHPTLVEAIHNQAQILINPSPAFYNAPMLQLAGLLTAHSAFDHVFFANSGAEANEGAIKLARKWGGLHKNGAYKIISFNNAFHGRTLATMAASGKSGWDDLFEPKVPGFIKVPYNCLDAVADAIDAQTVAVMLEPIQGEAGVIPADRSFIEGLRQLTRQHDILLIFDEIQTGIGRTGKLFCYQHFGVEPDIMTLGKGLGGGVPLAALLAKRQSSCFAPGDQGGTFNGNPLATAAGCAVVKHVLQSSFLPQVREKSRIMRQCLADLAEKHGLGEIRGRGLLLALDTREINAAAIVKRAFDSGLLLNAPRHNALRFMPALTVTMAEIRQLSNLLDMVISDIRAGNGHPKPAANQQPLG